MIATFDFNVLKNVSQEEAQKILEEISDRFAIKCYTTDEDADPVDVLALEITGQHKPKHCSFDDKMHCYIEHTNLRLNNIEKELKNSMKDIKSFIMTVNKK